MISDNLQASLNKAYKRDPKQSEMIMQSMDKMPSMQGMDESQVGSAAKGFLHLDNVTNYTQNFLESPNTKPEGFAPPRPPNSSPFAAEDAHGFVENAIDHCLSRWDSTQQEKMLESNFKGDAVSKEAATEKGTAVKMELENSNDNKSLLGTAVEAGLGPAGLIAAQGRDSGLAEAAVSQEAMIGATKGFMTGGKVGAAKGYATGVMTKMAKDKASSYLSDEPSAGADTGPGEETKSSSRPSGPSAR